MTSHSTARSALRRTVAVGTALALGASAAVLSATTANAAAAPGSTPAFEDGRYIVVLAEDALATYDGGITGLAPTAPQRGQDLDVSSPAARAYASHLQDRHEDVAASVGATVDVELTAAINGFVADLTADQAQDLAHHPGVRAVEANEILQLTSSPANDYLELPALWEQVGGASDAGDGVVVGVLDTGIAPENPFFAGAPLGTTPGDEPYRAADGTIRYVKGDGSEFTGVCQTGPGFTADDCSTKIVGARYYLSGFGASRIGTETQVPGEYASPRDGDGHGSHTASTAAGNADVAITSVGGADLGTMSGVAPAARIAAYKVCWSGPDPAVSTDDGCASSDLVAAIDQAVIDGVDVINYSIGGGAATSVVAATDISFLGAAAAGVFVSASAGNSGPGASTLDHASPWYTTVAATTIPNYEATVTLADGTKVAGGSITVPFDGSVTGTLVYAGDIPAAGRTAADAALCLPGSLDAAAAAGNIVLCDRGVNARVEKSQVAAAAGAIGAIVANVTPGSIDLDDHAIPTVHIDAQFRAPVLAAAKARETVTLTPGNTSGVATPAPVVAGFSSRGPALADGSDVIKPDIAAPGVGIIAAAWQAPGGPDRFEFLSGTSMAAPHIAGLAAVYLSEHPLASPAEVKSALMTSAQDTVRADGSRETNPFSQGAGIVDSPTFLEPGLYYENGTEDWFGYLRGLGYGLPASWVGEAIDPSDLNIPSIGIGALAGTQTVTRSLTALEPGTYGVSVEGVDGVAVEVSTDELVFTEAGQTLSFEVTFSTTTATPDTWTTGFLTWSNEAHSVRSPIAVRPLALDVPEWASAEGRMGRLAIDGIAGTDGELTTATAGFAPYETLGSDSGVTDDEFVYSVTIPAGELVHDFTLAGDESVADLDLYIYRLNSAGQPVEQWIGGTSSADEAVMIEDPEPGQYLALVHAYSVAGGAATPFILEHAGLQLGAGKGKLTASPASQQVSAGDEFQVTVDWRGLGANQEYLGAVIYEIDGFQDRTYIYAESTPGPTTGRGQTP
ncbi:S8 family peptidase [Agrococcus sp. HG114]|uniref:S8 family peptidase n=1 Tax=Agrococcus sp. HG114 TaxID=2969757 RepID=UPI00215B1E97|nr:S8 family serine peptidase [Agrococcus sp. HG114]MCR8670385.1 S8 family serine peptidase [Agrococcus sp. HG114]